MREADHNRHGRGSHTNTAATQLLLHALERLLREMVVSVSNSPRSDPQKCSGRPCAETRERDEAPDLFSYVIEPMGTRHHGGAGSGDLVSGR
jgi:hypothetical protein